MAKKIDKLKLIEQALMHDSITVDSVKNGLGELEFKARVKLEKIKKSQKTKNKYLKKHVIKNTNAETVVASIKDYINSDRVYGDEITGTFLKGLHTLQGTPYTLIDYARASKYTTLLYFGFSNFQAWKKVFPKEIAKYNKKGKSIRKLRRQAKIFHKSPLVQKLLDVIQLEVHLQYSDIYHKAIKTQKELMENAKSDFVRQKAATDLMNHLAKPANVTANGVDEQDALKRSREDQTAILSNFAAAMHQLAQSQKEAISKGHTTALNVAAERLTKKVETEQVGTVLDFKKIKENTYVPDE